MSRDICRTGAHAILRRIVFDGDSNPAPKPVRETHLAADRMRVRAGQADGSRR
jgi:hypothetical protein